MIPLCRAWVCVFRGDDGGRRIPAPVMGSELGALVVVLNHIAVGELVAEEERLVVTAFVHVVGVEECRVCRRPVDVAIVTFGHVLVAYCDDGCVLPMDGMLDEQDVLSHEVGHLAEDSQLASRELDVVGVEFVRHGVCVCGGRFGSSSPSGYMTSRHEPLVCDP